MVDVSLLSGRAREMALGAADHPWLVPPKGALAGSAAHIALLAALAQAFTWGVELVLIRFRSEEHTSELQPLMRISYAVFCLKKKKTELVARLRDYKHNLILQTT